LVLEGFQNKLEPWTFSAQWLRDNHGTKCKIKRINTEENHD
jgi:hypothetical protein